MSRVCTVCARGDSKGVPGKNLRSLLGRPLIAWTLTQASDSGLFDLIAVSSDSAEILAAARAHGAGLAVERPAVLATDRADKVGAILHALEAAETAAGQRFDVVVDLDVTAPLRLADDIRGAVALLEESGVSNVITGCPARRSPYFNLVEARPDGSVGLSKPTDPPVRRRQDAPACYDMNAAIYVWRRDALVERPGVFYPDTRLFEMPEDRSHDIDSELDLALVEVLMQRMMAA